MTELVRTDGETVYLSTSLDESLFAKTKFSRFCDAAGFIAEKEEGGDGIVFSEWKFDGVKTMGETVFLCGNAFAGTSVASLLDDAAMLLAVCSAYAASLSRGIRLPCNAPSGILYDGKRLLFLPESAFDRAAANAGPEYYAKMQEPWRDANAQPPERIAFSLAVYAYYALARTLPYPPDAGAKKCVSIAHRNFLPLEYAAVIKNPELSKAVNAALGGKKSMAAFPLNLLQIELSRSDRGCEKEQEVLRISAERFQKRQKQKLQAKQIYRRLFAKIAASAAFAIFVLIFTLSVLHERGKKPCVIGLSSAECAAVFYQGIHQMDTDLILAAAKNCPEAQRYIAEIPQIYAMSQMRSVFNLQAGISTPENWLFFEPDSPRAYSRTVYGITGFTLDGKPLPLTAAIPTNRAHPPRIRIEDGERIKNRTNKTHTARFYLVRTVDAMLQIERYAAELSLCMENDRWQIRKLNQERATENISPAVFSAELKSALTECRGDVMAAAALLRPKYPWLPSAEALKTERERLDAIGY